MFGGKGKNSRNTNIAYSIVSFGEGGNNASQPITSAKISEKVGANDVPECDSPVEASAVTGPVPNPTEARAVTGPVPNPTEASAVTGPVPNPTEARAVTGSVLNPNEASAVTGPVAKSQ